MWGSYHSLSLCLPAYQFVHLFVFLSSLTVGVCLSGTLSAIDQSFVVPIKITIWCLWWKHPENTNPCFYKDVRACCGISKWVYFFFLCWKNGWWTCLQIRFTVLIRIFIECHQYIVWTQRKKYGGGRVRKGGKKEQRRSKKKWKRHRWRFGEKRAQATLCSELIICFKDVSKRENGLYNSIYCPT